MTDWLSVLQAVAVALFCLTIVFLAVAAITDARHEEDWRRRHPFDEF